MILNLPSMSLKMDICIGYFLNIQTVVMYMIYRGISIFPWGVGSMGNQRLEVIRVF